MTPAYTYPTAKLLKYGDCRSFMKWPDYLSEFGFTSEHIPELIRMATDKTLNWAGCDSSEVWAPVHAWRALGQLHAEEATEPLMSLLHEPDDADWAREELPIVFQMIGQKAVPALVRYLAEDSHGTFPRIAAGRSLKRIGNAFPEVREQCLEALGKHLERFRDNNPTLNAFLISCLTDLRAMKLLPLIKQAFDSDSVDLMVAGDLEDIEIEFGVRKQRSEPRPLTPLQKSLGPILEQIKIRQEAKDRIQMRKKDRTQQRVKDRIQQETKGQKIGRNKPCPCGSGKKYKKCCLNKQGVS
ncbi:HEAT repeat domain-containing protein [Desulfonema magnum]|uniref:SEC-C motiv-containing protein n=1 Tax=Desulfonema magnum TaxID=45655 RepID=A0A975BJL2_9BACT|nr:SEC-C metal-binding domain-containing protein [Desulfonema magnum]QTA86335.1 SEC-C motiv-containing protein [Desulfonema magnum]